MGVGGGSIGVDSSSKSVLDGLVFGKLIVLKKGGRDEKCEELDDDDDDNDDKNDDSKDDPPQCTPWKYT